MGNKNFVLVIKQHYLLSFSSVESLLCQIVWSILLCRLLLLKWENKEQSEYFFIHTKYVEKIKVKLKLYDGGMHLNKNKGRLNKVFSVP